MARGVRPIAVERPFAAHELFFSTTDRKGVIRSGNRVFTRVSGYSQAELLGAPHNIVRHPDMPRVVFRLLWEEIGAERPIAAYVKNLASDGTYYWVLATVVAVEDGYLSVRIKPSSPLLATVTALYEELRAVEAHIEERGGTPKEAMEASAELLRGRLRELGFAGYSAFMRVALPVELRGYLEARDAEEAHAQTQPADTGGPLGDALGASAALRRVLAAEFARIDRYEQVDTAFAGKSDTVLALADEIRLFSLNAQIGAAQLQDVGAALGVIADIMRIRSDAVAGSVRETSASMDHATSILHTLAFDVALATLQCETANQFMREVEQTASATDADPAVLAANVRALTGCLEAGLAPLGARLTELHGDLDRVARGVDELHEELGRLEMLQVAGRVETARLGEAGEFGALFQEIRTQVETAKAELRDLDIVRALLRTRATGANADVIARHLGVILAWARPGASTTRLPRAG